MVRVSTGSDVIRFGGSLMGGGENESGVGVVVLLGGPLFG